MKTLCILFLVCILIGCSEPRGAEKIRKAFPDADIIRIPKQHYAYLVREMDGTIYWVYSNGMSDKPKHQVKLLKPLND